MQAMPATQKVCNECREEQPAGEFFLGDGRYLSAACKPCSAVRVRRHRAARKAKYGAMGHHFVAQFGITVEQYGEMLARQGGVCAICGVENVRGMSLAVDHDHQSGRVRGLLCNPCNSAVGLFADDPERLRAAIDYLTEEDPA